MEVKLLEWHKHCATKLYRAKVAAIKTGKQFDLSTFVPETEDEQEDLDEKYTLTVLDISVDENYKSRIFEVYCEACDLPCTFAEIGEHFTSKRHAMNRELYTHLKCRKCDSRYPRPTRMKRAKNVRCDECHAQRNALQ